MRATCFPVNSLSNPYLGTCPPAQLLSPRRTATILDHVRGVADLDALGLQAVMMTWRTDRIISCAARILWRSRHSPGTSTLSVFIFALGVLSVASPALLGSDTGLGASGREFPWRVDSCRLRHRIPPRDVCPELDARGLRHADAPGAWPTFDPTRTLLLESGRRLLQTLPLRSAMRLRVPSRSRDTRILLCKST